MNSLFGRNFYWGYNYERLAFTPLVIGTRFFVLDINKGLYLWDGTGWLFVGPTGGGSGVPSDTVVSETGYGQAVNAGTDSTYSRGNHTHGTPAVPVIDHANLSGVTATQHHSNANDPAAGQKLALQGTNGTPGDSNRFVTDSDPRNTNARAPTAHAHPESDVTNLVSDLAGKEPANANIQSHIASTANPHATTAAQAGALASTAFVGLAKITVAVDAPLSPSIGDLWIDI